MRIIDFQQTWPWLKKKYLLQKKRILGKRKHVPQKLCVCVCVFFCNVLFERNTPPNCQKRSRALPGLCHHHETFLQRWESVWGLTSPRGTHRFGSFSPCTHGFSRQPSVSLVLRLVALVDKWKLQQPSI